MKVIKCLSKFAWVFLLLGCLHKPTIKTGREGTILPEFKLMLIDSSIKRVNINNYHNKPSILIYFSPTCPFCLAQIKQIFKNREDMREMDLYFITNFSLVNLKQFCQQFKLESSSNAVIGIDITNFISDYFKISNVPYIAVYNKASKLKGVFIGPTPINDIIQIAKY